MTTSKKSRYIKAAHQILVSLGLPRTQQNERSALCLLALLNLTPGKPWSKAENPLIGITPIMDWACEHYSLKIIQSPLYRPSSILIAFIRI